MKRIALILLVVAGVFGVSVSAVAATAQTHHSKVRKAVSTAPKGVSQKEQVNYGTHAEIYNYSHFTVIVRVPGSPDGDVILDPIGGYNVDYIDSPAIERCTNGSQGFDVMIFDGQYRLIFQGCVLNGEKKYIVDRQLKQAA